MGTGAGPDPGTVDGGSDADGGARAGAGADGATGVSVALDDLTGDLDPADRRSALRRVGAVVVVANLALFGAKGAVYAATGSLAVGSEAVNSLADSAYSLVVLVGLVLTTRPPDDDHPHGHERIEPFVSLFVAAGVVVAGGAVLWGAVESLRAGRPAGVGGPAAVAVLAVGAAVKFGLYRYCLRVGRRVRSPAVVAAGVDNRNDILAAGAALAGVVGAALGVPVLDPLAAAVVAVLVLYAGVGIARDNLTYLTGAAPPAELREAIVERALAHPEVAGVHDVVAHYVGPEVDVSLHVEVPGDMTLVEAHDLETGIVEDIRALPAVDDAFVHLDPAGIGEWDGGGGDRAPAEGPDGEATGAGRPDSGGPATEVAGAAADAADAADRSDRAPGEPKPTGTSDADRRP